jgi:hypothetical protein
MSAAQTAPSVWVATLETRNFTFEAAGESEAHARLALVEGLHAHGREYVLPHAWFDRYRDDGQLGRVVEMTLGTCRRDGELLK